MSVQSQDGEQATGSSDLLTIGFATTVAMWGVGYVGHMPLTDVPPLVFVGFMLACLTAGGWTVGRYTVRGLRGGVLVGLLVAVLNLLILGSVLAHPSTGQLVPQAWVWVPGYFLVFLALASLGAAVGTVNRSKSIGSIQSVHAENPIDWLTCFAWVAAAATLLLISIGGLVTGFRAGMAVPDWPNTYGSNMFLYPLAKMTGGVFYEHAHRLLGSLVGVTALTLAILLTVHRRSIWARVSIWIVAACVGLQGLLGGLRVTDNSTHLAVVHGFFAHLILAGMVGVAVLLARRDCNRGTGFSPSLKRADETTAPQKDGASMPGGTDRLLTSLLVLAVMAQTLLGTLVRQMDIGLMIHLSVALVVALLAINVGIRLWGLYPQLPTFARGGMALVCAIVLQLGLGATSLVFRTPPAATSPSAEQLRQQTIALQPAVHAIVTTAHQTTAAVLLAIATFLAVGCWGLRGTKAPSRRL